MTNHRYKTWTVKWLAHASCAPRWACCCLVLSALLFGPRADAADQQTITVTKEPGRLRIDAGSTTITTYVYSDEEIPRPYFTNVRSPSGVQVTRHHPPRPGKDSTDHPTYHPGIWLAFGDIGGADFWRNRAAVQHIDFVEQPRCKQNKLSFTVKNRYVDEDRVICTEVCRHQIVATGIGYLLTYESAFRSDDEPFAFGDQEEMGLGVRVASGIRVTGGNGRIINSDGHKNEKGVRGTNADWVDYSGTIGQERAGMLVMPDPANFRRSWYHARNYGFVAANPFGRNALTGNKKSRVEVKPGETFKLGYGIFIYATPTDEPFDFKAAYEDYLSRVGDKK